MTITTHSEAETAALSSRIAEKLCGGEVILLNGQLGAGKTTFTKGLAKGLGIAETVTSPTFTIMKEYKGRLRLYHFDMYRIVDPSETEELGLDELLYDPEGVCVIEWNKFPSLKNTITVDIEYVGDNERKFTVKGVEL